MSQLVSIGVPVYNGEKYLRQALESLLSQSHSNIEVIISDNASTDATERICREVAAKDKRVSYIRQQSNNGPIGNFNFVLQQAQGEYFMWAAHDDFWDEGWLAALVPCIKGNIVMAYGQILGFSNRIESPIAPGNLGNMSSSFARGLGYFWAHERRGKANLIYGVFQKDILNKHYFPKGPQYKFGSDMHIVFTAIQQGAFVFEPKAVMYKRLAMPQKECKRVHIFESLRLMKDILIYYLGYGPHARFFALRVAILILTPIKLARILGEGIFRQLQRGVRA